MSIKIRASTFFLVFSLLLFLKVSLVYALCIDNADCSPGSFCNTTTQLCEFGPEQEIQGVLPDQIPGQSNTVFGDTVNRVISASFVIAGLVFLVYFIYGAFYYITSAGDDKKVESARKIMTNATIGFAFLALVFLISSLLGVIFGFNILDITFQRP